MAAAAYLQSLLAELASHDEALCSWPGDGVCQATLQLGSMSCEFRPAEFDYTNYVAVFSRQGQGPIGEWFVRTAAVGELDLGTMWHLIAHEIKNLSDPATKWPRVRWDPEFQFAEHLQLYREPERVAAGRSDWEAGKVPFAQFVASR